MIVKKLEDPYSKYAVAISAFKVSSPEGTAKLISSISSTGNLEDKPVKQFFNAENIATWNHLYLAAYFTVKSIKKSASNIKAVEIELLRYASAKKQLKEALSDFGVKMDDTSIAALLIGVGEQQVAYQMADIMSSHGLVEDLSLLDLTKEKLDRLKIIYGIGDVELTALLGGGVQYTSLMADTMMKLIINRMSSLILKK